MNRILEDLTCLCLCLDRRKEHWQRLQKEVEELGVNFIPFICGDGSDKELVYDQIDVKNPDCSLFGYGVPHLKHHHYNALLAHKNIVRKSRELGLSRVLMMEDDAYVCKRLLEVLNNLEEKDLEIAEKADLLYLGFWHQPDDAPFNVECEDYWNSTKRSRIKVMTPAEPTGGFHSCIVKESVYDFILDAKMTNPIDGLLSANSDRFLSVLILPKVIHTITTHSYTEGITIQRALL